MSPTTMSRVGVSPSAVTAPIAPSRSDGVTENTGCTVGVARATLSCNELLVTMLVNHVQREAVVRGSFVDFWI